MVYLQLLINGVVMGCIYALVAVGFGLIYGTTRVFHFAHGAIYTASAYVFYTFSHVFGWGLPESALAAVTLAAAFGLLTDELLYRFIYRRRGSHFTLMLSSLGLYTIIINVIAIVYGNGTILLEADLNFVFFRPLRLTALQGVTLLTFAALFGLLALFLMKTRAGKAVRAVRDNADLAAALGFDPRAVRRLVFSLGSAFAAVAAILFSLDRGLNPNVGMNVLLTAAVAIILGGIGRFRGAVLGALIIGLLHSVIIWEISARWVDAVAFVVLIVFLIRRTEGVYTPTRRADEVAA